MQFLKDDSEVFDHQPKRIYELDTDVVRPAEAAQSAMTVGPAPNPLIARTSLSNFASRPPETDLDTYSQVCTSSADAGCGRASV